MSALLKLMRYREFLGRSSAPGGGGSTGSTDFLELKETMTVYRNDTITELPECAFCSCTNLKMVVLPAVTSVGVRKENAWEEVKPNEFFKNCSSLEVADFTALTILGDKSWMNSDSNEVEYTNPLPTSTKALINRGGLFQMGVLDDYDVWDAGGDVNPTCGIELCNTYIYVPCEYIKEENFIGAEYYNEDVEETFLHYPNGYDWHAIYKKNKNRIRAIEDYTVDGTIMGELDFAKMGIS